MMRRMPQPASISAFPWESLERVPRVAARDWGRFNRVLAARAGSVAAPLARALGRWLHVPVRFEWCSLRAGLAEPSREFDYFDLRVDPGPIQVRLQLDPRLVTRLVRFALERPDALQDPRQPSDEALLGAAAAIVVKLIEDARLEFAVELLDAPLEIPNPARVTLEALVYIDGVAYRACIGLSMKPLGLPARQSSRASFVALGRLPLGLPLVIGASLVTRGLLAELEPATAFLPGAGLWVDGSGTGRGVLIAPQSDSGLAVELAPGGRLVLLDTHVTLQPDEPTSTAIIAPEAAKAPPPAPDAARDPPQAALDAPLASAAEGVPQALLDAPVVLRVELAMVSLPAEQWAALRVGDIVETGKPLGTEVVLRVAGQALAKGELMSVDGELGVRITKLLAEEA